MSTLWCVSLHNSLPSNVGLNCEYNGALRREIFFYEPDLIRWVLAALFLENEIEGEWIFFFFDTSENMLLVLNMEKATSQGMWVAFRSWAWPPADSQHGIKDCSPTTVGLNSATTAWVSKEELSCRWAGGWLTLLLACEAWAVKPVSLCLDFWPLELGANKLVLFKVARFVVIGDVTIENSCREIKCLASLLVCYLIYFWWAASSEKKKKRVNWTRLTCIS